MKTGLRLFAIVLDVALIRASAAGALVTASNPDGEIHGGYGNTSTAYLYAPADFHMAQPVFNRSPLSNHVDWELTNATSTASFALSSDAYSAFFPATMGIDRFGNPTSSPAFYVDATVSARYPLALDRPLYVSVFLNGSGLRGLRSFSMDYFGRHAMYESDPAAGSILPMTSLPQRTDTSDPLDVADLVDSFWMNAGSYPMQFEMKTTHIAGQPFFDGNVTLNILFSTVPEPASVWIAVGVFMPLSLKRRARP